MIEGKEKLQQLYEIAKLYYEEKLSQDDIARIFKVSRATVSRSLAEAEEKNIVQIKVVDLLGSSKKTAQEIEKKYGLKKVIVAHAPYESSEIVKRNIGREAAKYIVDLVREKQSIGIAWGTTILEMVKSLHPKHVESLNVVELIGSAGHISTEFTASELARRFAENFSAKRFVLQSPALVSSIDLKNSLISEKNIREVMEMGKRVDVAIVGIGAIDYNSPVYRALNLSQKDMNEILAADAVGDICFRFFDIDGNKCKLSFDERLIGIDLDDFKKIGLRIGVAGGENKVESIRGAISNLIINVLVTDRFTANELL